MRPAGSARMGTGGAWSKGSNRGVRPAPAGIVVLPQREPMYRPLCPHPSHRIPHPASSSARRCRRCRRPQAGCARSRRVGRLRIQVSAAAVPGARWLAKRREAALLAWHAPVLQPQVVNAMQDGCLDGRHRGWAAAAPRRRQWAAVEGSSGRRAGWATLSLLQRLGRTVGWECAAGALRGAAWAVGAAKGQAGTAGQVGVCAPAAGAALAAHAAWRAAMALRFTVFLPELVESFTPGWT